MRCVLHGSFRKHFEEIRRVHRLFSEAGIEVLAPTLGEIVSQRNGFSLLSTDHESDPRMIELLYLSHLKHLGEDGFSYFVNPEGYIGKSASYELGIAHATNVPCFFMHAIDNHPAYLHGSSVWKPELLVEWIANHHALPEPTVHANARKIHHLWRKLLVPGSTVAVGGIIEYDSVAGDHEKEVLLVKTHKWGGRYSMVGGKVMQRERLEDALVREVKEETGLVAKVGRHLCTFDQIKNSGYYDAGTQHIFVDAVVQVESKKVVLNEEAQEYLWLPASVALRDLDIEPNARYTLMLYAQTKSTMR